MSSEVTIEPRNCERCGRSFRVLAQSQQKHCSRECVNGVFGTRGRTEPSHPSRKKENQTERVTIEIKNPPPKDMGQLVATRNAYFPKNRKLAGDSRPDCGESETEKNTTPGDVPMLPQGETVLESLPERTISPTESGGSSRLPTARTDTIPQESSEEQFPSIEVESSNILNLSKESANRLMLLMKATVTDQDLQKQNEGAGRVEAYKVELAIKCANSIANIVQTNVNLLKAMKGMSRK